MLKPNEFPPVLGFSANIHFDRTFLIEVQNELIRKAIMVQADIDEFSKVDEFAITFFKRNGYWTED